MKKFLLKTFYFVCLPLVCWALTEVLLPPTFFAFRHYEALAYEKSIPHISENYPNVNSTMNAVGDLCHHTPKAIIKKEHWITDALGFRNEVFIARPDIVIIGDSYLQGSGMSQEETLTSRLSVLMPDVKIYSMAPSSFNRFDYYLKSGVIKKPAVIVYELAERNLPNPLMPERSTAGKLRQLWAKTLEIGHFNVTLSKIMKAQSLEWCRARLNGSTGLGIPAKGNEDMFFLRGTENTHSEADVNTAANTIASYQAHCDALGIAFIFLPMPDKETVYYEMVPFDRQPDYLSRLGGVLRRRNIKTINTVSVYNRYRQKNQALLYHYDDTHWNANGVNVVAPVLAEAIRQALPQKPNAYEY